MGKAINMYPNLRHETQFRLNKIIKVKYYFISEIWKRKTISRRLAKYISIFGYFDKALIVLSAISGGLSIISFSRLFGAPEEIASVSFTFAFSLTTGIIKKLLEITRKKRKKHNKIVMLARSKLNNIESTIKR